MNLEAETVESVEVHRPATQNKRPPQISTYMPCIVCARAHACTHTHTYRKYHHYRETLCQPWVQQVSTGRFTFGTLANDLQGRGEPPWNNKGTGVSVTAGEKGSGPLGRKGRTLRRRLLWGSLTQRLTQF